MTTHALRRPLLLLSALLTALLLVLIPTGPAQAHDRLTESDPAQGETLDSAPEEVTLTYSAAIQGVGGSVKVLDSEGNAVDVGSPTTEGPTVTTPIEEDLVAGDYEISWRVVSSDGHAISGVIDFTVAEGAAASSTSTTSSSSTAPSETSTEDASPEDSTADGTASDDSESAADEDSGSSTMPLLLGGLAVVVVLGAGFALLRSRRANDS